MRRESKKKQNGIGNEKVKKKEGLAQERDKERKDKIRK